MCVIYLRELSVWEPAASLRLSSLAVKYCLGFLCDNSYEESPSVFRIWNKKVHQRNKWELLLFQFVTVTDGNNGSCEERNGDEYQRGIITEQANGEIWWAANIKKVDEQTQRRIVKKTQEGKETNWWTTGRLLHIPRWSQVFLRFWHFLLQRDLFHSLEFLSAASLGPRVPVRSTRTSTETFVIK